MAMDNVTCLDFLNSQEQLLSNDTACSVGQALAWRNCGCPSVPPIDDGNCTLCVNHGELAVPSLPDVDCVEETKFVSLMGTRNPGQCPELLKVAFRRCRCPSDYYIELLNIVSDVVEDPTDFRVVGSAQNMALNWMAYKDRYRTNRTSLIRERFAVVVLYYSLGGDSWTGPKDYFRTESRVCDWHQPDVDNGVYCGVNETVTEIWLCKFHTIPLI